MELGLILYRVHISAFVASWAEIQKGNPDLITRCNIPIAWQPELDCCCPSLVLAGHTTEPNSSKKQISTKYVFVFLQVLGRSAAHRWSHTDLLLQNSIIIHQFEHRIFAHYLRNQCNLLSVINDIYISYIYIDIVLAAAAWRWIGNLHKFWLCVYILWFLGPFWVPFDAHSLSWTDFGIFLGPFGQPLD